MKIRIKGNSIRLRLTKSEVQRLSTEGAVMESTQFPNVSFKYNLFSDKTISELTASFSENTISIRMPEAMAKSWVDSDQIGYERRIALSNSNEGNTLYLLIEKDFACLDNSREDEDDNYANPNEKC